MEVIASRCVTDSLKDELFGEDGVLSLPRVCLSHLDTVQVDITIGIGKILHWQLVGLLHIQHQAANLREKNDLAKKNICRAVIIGVVLPERTNRTPCHLS